MFIHHHQFHHLSTATKCFKRSTGSLLNPGQPQELNQDDIQESVQTEAAAAHSQVRPRVHHYYSLSTATNAETRGLRVGDKKVSRLQPPLPAG